MLSRRPRPPRPGVDFCSPYEALRSLSALVPPHAREGLFPGYRDPGYMGYGTLPAGGFRALHGSDHLPFGPHPAIGMRTSHSHRRPPHRYGMRRGYPSFDDDSDYEDDLPYFPSRVPQRRQPYRPGDIERFDYYSGRRRPGLHGLSRYYDRYRDGYDSDSMISRMYDDDDDSDYISPFSYDDLYDDMDDPFFFPRRRSRTGRGGRY